MNMPGAALNSNEAYHKVATRKPNAWGLYDMHGNVAEWTLDAHDAAFYKQFEGKSVKNPLAVPKKLYPQVARGGSWDDEADRLRSAARRPSNRDWKQQDPQIPQSIWYFTDAQFLGFRVVRPCMSRARPKSSSSGRLAPTKTKAIEPFRFPSRRRAENTCFGSRGDGH